MGNKIFVGGLNWDATDDDLRETFGECGSITDAVIVNDRDTGRSRGFGFVTYSSDEEAKAAVEKFDGQDFMGRKLTVNEARQREEGGGGVKGGQVIGSTDELGLWATEDRLHVHDLHATVLHLLGIHNLDLIYRYKGRPETPTINEGAAYTKITLG
jgi:RNA recognition motif-containing protein